MNKRVYKRECFTHKRDFNTEQKKKTLPEDSAWCGFSESKNEDWPLLKPCHDVIGIELNSARNRKKPLFV